LNFISYVCQFVSLTCIVYYFRLDEFMAGFNLISLKLKEMYQVMNTYSISVLLYVHIARIHIDNIIIR
jgi:hypothetical protein